ncbi:MAG TPA: hypothetical protein VNJ01_11140 [Bacteriovoracaceae bacterium]|nr:hypothetical protein [Bacteriovoracaceae bacterium]
MALSFNTSALAFLSTLTLLAGCSEKSVTENVLLYSKSNPCTSTGRGLSSGTTTISEDFNQGTGAAGFRAENSPCWKNFQDSYPGTSSANHRKTFEVTSMNGVSVNTRKLTVTHFPELSSNASVSYAPHGTPNTGFDTGQFPYVIDLFKTPVCYGDVAFRVHVKPQTIGATTSMYGALLNARVTGVGAARRISGYLIHIYGDATSTTLVKFDQAYDHAFDFSAHSPGIITDPNPTIDGPYKGWDYTSSVFPAGGYPNGDDEVQIAARYRYDTNLGTATIDWELRPPNGSDGSPGTYDFTRTLSGADALAPGGGYGIYTSMFGALASGTTNNLFIGPVRLDCTN